MCPTFSVGRVVFCSTGSKTPIHLRFYGLAEFHRDGGSGSIYGNRATYISSYIGTGHGLVEHAIFKPESWLVTQSILVYRDGSVSCLAPHRSAGTLFQPLSVRGSCRKKSRSVCLPWRRQDTIEPGVLPRPCNMKAVRICSRPQENPHTTNSSRENKEGIAVLGPTEQWWPIFCWMAITREIGLGGRDCEDRRGSYDVTLERLFARGFHKFRIHIRNNCAFLKLTGCTAGCNDMANFRMTKLSGSNDSRLAGLFN